MSVKVLSASFMTMICLLPCHSDARPHDQLRAISPPQTSRGLARREADPGQEPTGSPAAVDVDRDGAVSPDEASAHYRWIFEFLDGDGDGALQASEFIAALQTDRPDPKLKEAQRQRLESMFRRLDANGDRAVHRREFLTACNAHFSSSDSDGDGRVSVLEFRSRRPL